MCVLTVYASLPWNTALPIPRSTDFAPLFLLTFSLLMKYISWSLLFPDFFLARCLVTAESAWARMWSSLLLGWWSRYNCCDPFGLVMGPSTADNLQLFPFPCLLQGTQEIKRPLSFWKVCCGLVFWILLNSDQSWVFLPSWLTHI